jgi:M6 family metalloprotease-like protein
VTGGRESSGDWPPDGKLKGRQGFTAAGQGTDRRVYASAVGRLRALVVGVDFPDAPAAEAEGPRRTVEDYAAFLVPGAQRWFARASAGRLRLEARVLPGWHRMSGSHRAYGFERGISHATHVAYIAEAVALAAGEADWAAFDVVYVVPPANAAGIRFSPAFIDGEGREGRPPSIPVGDGAVTRAVTFGQDMWHWGYKVLNHETGHTLGLPDLYAYRPVGDPPEAHPFVGGWDLMGLISGHAPDLLAWQKWRLGWIDDEQVAVVPPGGDRTVDLDPIEVPGGTKLALCPLDATRGLCVESRRPVLLDAGARDWGVLVYWVDAAVGSGRGTVRIVRPGRPESFARGDLDDACLRVGGPAVWEDEAAGVRVTVLAGDDDGDRVRITRR